MPVSNSHCYHYDCLIIIYITHDIISANQTVAAVDIHTACTTSSSDVVFDEFIDKEEGMLGNS
jgi:hypothetical protein